MNQKQIKALETQLWDSANSLRANSKLTAAEYKDPLLGLILLRYAQNRFEQAKARIEANLPPVAPGRTRKEPTKDQFLSEGAMLIPPQARYDHLAALPEDESISQAVNTAMTLIEAEYPNLNGVLPKNYHELGEKGQSETLLRELIRVFNQDAVKGLTGDVFGRIYEFFLMKFSMDGAGAQEGGEFFTPPALVQLIVNLIQPDHGVIHDPACGSGGMFVQTGHFLEENRGVKSVNAAIKCYGTELKSNNVRLAKMNLAIHGLEGKIAENNSFYADPHNLVGQCDFVMANPPFNVKKVDKDRPYVKNDPRLFGKVEIESADEETDKKKKPVPRLGIPNADNANYLWIQYFYHYLNAKGRAGFVMASSATDAGNSEKLIRQALIETQAVDCIVSVGNNFFYTRSLPCHVWFLDKGKRAENKQRILMIDARNTFRVVTNTINDYSPGQLVNFSAMMEAYRGKADAIREAAAQHEANIADVATTLLAEAEGLRRACLAVLKEESPLGESLEWDIAELQAEIIVDEALTLASSRTLCGVFEQPVAVLSGLLEGYQAQWEQARKAFAALEKSAQNTDDNKALKKQLDAQGKQLKALSVLIKGYFEKNSEELASLKQAVKDWQALEDYFPDGVYRDVEGLCKIVDLAEVAANDYSLTPGRYVGYSVDVNEAFDYQKRITEIHAELSNLNQQANSLMSFIQGIDL
ncbi:type I restriction-modification system subunit M [Thiothrix fructosivorans]|uniref:site-specific DNA-methyltransferase (adenine-specific) n=1 Tax=Thiothrix fructosivorans TaxID=111770 RepID=A0A8B0SMX1_9GAMM|nr:class I SAM-dependent DNA methyltransferase [Thiothrix fructosivorans]MBO0614194.1 N-6 DNA methylase [Thiothrix fructosivorans]QTX12676.1 N-6 DNA methylase [Thiothrix fructosivorans]